MIGIAENNFCEWRSTARIVDYILNNTPDVAMAFGIVQGTELGRSFIEAGAVTSMLGGLFRSLLNGRRTGQ